MTVNISNEKWITICRFSKSDIYWDSRAFCTRIVKLTWFACLISSTKYQNITRHWITINSQKRARRGHWHLMIPLPRPWLQSLCFCILSSFINLVQQLETNHEVQTNKTTTTPNCHCFQQFNLEGRSSNEVRHRNLDLLNCWSHRHNENYTEYNSDWFRIWPNRST